MCCNGSASLAVVLGVIAFQRLRVLQVFVPLIVLLSVFTAIVWWSVGNYEWCAFTVQLDMHAVQNDTPRMRVVRWAAPTSCMLPLRRPSLVQNAFLHTAVGTTSNEAVTLQE